MVDSAPELWLTVPSPCTPSLVTPVAGSYTGTGGVLAEEPAGRDAGQLRIPGRLAATDREQTLNPGIGAIGDLGCRSVSAAAR